MNDQELKSFISYSRILNEEISRKKSKLKILKRHLSKVNKLETSFDKNSSSYTSSTNPYYEDYVRKKRSNNIILSDNFRLEDDEIVEDLNKMCKDDDKQIRILDSTLYIKNDKFNKFDRVTLSLSNQECAGHITSIDSEGLVVKNRDGKRHKVKINDLLSGSVKISKQSRNK